MEESETWKPRRRSQILISEYEFHRLPGRFRDEGRERKVGKKVRPSAFWCGLLRRHPPPPWCCAHCPVLTLLNLFSSTCAQAAKCLPRGCSSADRTGGTYPTGAMNCNPPTHFAYR